MCMYVYSSFSEGTYRHVIHTCVHMSIGASVKEHIYTCVGMSIGALVATQLRASLQMVFQNAFLDQECTEDEGEEQMLD